MTELVKSFFMQLRVLNYSQATINDYAYNLRSFTDWLATKQVHDVQGITRALVCEYQVHCFEKLNRRGKHDAVGTRNNALKTVKAFCAFLADQGHVLDDPAKRVRYARMPKRLPRSILTPAEMRRLLQMPTKETAVGCRDRCIMELLYSTGLRSMELRNLKLTDLNLEEGILQVIDGKGHKDRYVPVGKVACRHLVHYIAHVRPMLLKKRPCDALFLTVRGAAMDKQSVGAAVTRYVGRAGIKKTITPHSFRHTCATHLLQNKANLRHIQEILGHASLETTQLYTSVTIQELKEAHAQCHPREREQVPL